MNIRVTDTYDMKRIKELCDEQDIEVPSNPLECYMVEEEGRVIGFISISVIAECTIALDTKESPRLRTKAIRTFNKFGDYVAYKHGFNRVYAICRDNMVSIAEKMGFKVSKGILLHKDI